MTMGERIAAKRKQKGFTQEYLAAKPGISRQSVSKWEKDITRPDTANLMRLSRLLDTCLQDRAKKPLIQNLRLSTAPARP